MRRTTRALAGALLATGLGLSGCGGDDEADVNEGVTEEQFEEDEVGSEDPVDGGDEDPDGTDPGTGGLDEDDDTVLDEDVPPGQTDDNSVDGEDGTPSTEEGM
ncbi:hypothetical protein SAMN04515665_13411 [Blastococcus sp. DSM 46786]|uniref:hypothetical protein n=1 Tax=Blastococcus sp. DSM 46786 TaxID=1798227 RepID=UPI0008BD38EB|nr:hypothetical protein [Blastococcus sp. DSM 46786]SEM14001.1 hypothetical protein SAMN04515665_13411 [Blastococcus sp. DSM 46786]